MMIRYKRLFWIFGVFVLLLAGCGKQTDTISPSPQTEETAVIIQPTEGNAISLPTTNAEQTTLPPTVSSPAEPTPTLVHQALNQMLAQQTEAVLSNDITNYLDAFTIDLHAEQQTLFERLQSLPLTSYTFLVDPNERLSSAHTGKLHSIGVRLSYTFSGIPEDNVFQHNLDIDFFQEDDIWRIGRIRFKDNIPFWHAGDVAVTETPHFLIFTRPEAASEQAILQQEVESAYEALIMRGLPLDSHYVAFFSGTDERFAELTGAIGRQVLGVALARFDVGGEEIIVQSRAFYINGQAFTTYADRLSPDDRQITIRHELVHLALSQYSRPFTPPWLVEGMAVFYAGQDTPEERRFLIEKGQLDEINLEELTAAASLGEHDLLGERASTEYSYAGATIAYLIETYGEEAVFDFYRSYAAVMAVDVRDRMPLFGNPFATSAVFKELSTELTSGAVQSRFGRTLADLDADVKVWLLLNAN